MVDCFLVLVLAWFSIEDIRYKSVSLWQIIAALVLAVICRLLIGTGCEEGLWDALIGLIICIGLAAYSLWRHSIGMADVCIVVMIGIMKGFVFGFSALLAAMFIMSAINVIRLVVKRVSVGDSMAFVPYIQIGVWYMLVRGLV